MDGDRSGKYDGLTQQQLVALLEKRDRTRKLGLVWERAEIEPDGHAAETNFVAATPVPELHECAAPWRNLVIEGDNWDALRQGHSVLPSGLICPSRREQGGSS